MDTGAVFENFITASTFRSIQNAFYQLCIVADIDPSESVNVYKKLRLLDDWKAQKLFKLLDKKWELAEYKKQKAGERLNVFVIGAGPCGLRAAIECALLGSRVVLVEQRDRFSRNNVLHLWEFVIQDLKSLGAKIFYPKFCTGSIEHISIRQLQCILLKVALCFGVQIHDSVSFVQLLFPRKQDGHVTGFRACLEPKGHILSDYDIDVLIAADGKRNTVPGFPREEMRGKLAIGITANFVNNKTYAEERVPEISGVAYIFNQSFFKEMYAKTGVDLENIVYYKDDTHYFVMCAKKQSLLDMGVILQDNDDVSQLLSSQNVDQEALCRYAQAAADFATNGKLPSLDFAKNHRGEEDIAMFDFTSLYSSKCSVRLVERMNKYLLMGIVGDSLHEPFWPTGSGCARGFLGVLDTAWLIREYGLNQRGPLEMIAERESIYRLLAQVTKDNMNKAINKYTIDPRTRYVSLETTLQPEDVVQIVSSDNPRMAPIGQALVLNNASSVHANPALRKYSLWKFCHQALAPYKLKLFDLDVCWNDGRALAGLVAKFRPDALDYFEVISMQNVNDRLQAVFNAVREEMGIVQPCVPHGWAHLRGNAKFDYIEKIVHYIRTDSKRLKNAMVTSRPHVLQKRKNQKPVVSSNPKRSGSIQRLADNLMGCSSFTAPGTMAVENTVLSSSACVYPDIENMLETDRLPHKNSTVVRRYSFKTSTEQKDEDSKYYTKRPQVDRLNPELVQKVERIVSGDLTKERESEFYAEKTRKAERFTQRLPKNNIEEMEKRLENSGMGVLYAKKEHISSQDEKIIRANAAYARKEAESGFSNEEKLSRFKDYDNKIAKSEEVMKRRDLAGVDPFEKWRLPNPYPSAMAENDDQKSSVPPIPPRKTKAVVQQPDGVIMRPVAPVQPKRHMSAPVMPSLYDSVNARRQETCRLCEKVVYLAERMQVESMFVHKNCFRCAYCNQPLRLGEYGKDKDLEYHYPRRFFCKTHLRAPLKEKVARIERAVRLLEKNSSRQELSAEIAQIDASPTGETPSVMPVLADPLMQCSATLSFFSPEQLRDRTVQRMRDCGVGGPISPVSEVASVDERTPERAEFSNQLRKSSLVPYADSKKPELELNASNSSFEEDESDECDACSSCSLDSHGEADRISDERLSGSADESSASEGEDDALEEGDLEELEKTVLQFSDENPEGPLTDAQVVSVINKINERRNAQLTTPRSSCESPAQNGMPEEKYYTPRELFFRDMNGSSNTSSASPGSATNKKLVEDVFVTPLAAPDAWDIRKKKAADLERLRTESRLKARLKTDEELGLENSVGDRRSMPVIGLSNTSSNGLKTTPKARDRGMSLSYDSCRTPKVARSLTVGAGDIAVQTVKIVEKIEEPKTKDNEVLSQTAASMPRPPSTGLLSRLFSPDSIRKPQPPQTTGSPVKLERIHSESRKETNMLGSTFRRFKLKREEHSARDTPSSSAHSSPCTSPHPVLCSSGEVDNRDVPCAAVAPSPRLEAGPSNSPTHISVNERNIRLFQKRAEKIRRQHDDERRRSAQEIQRGLQECEIRLEEIKSVGQSLEMRLLEDPENGWAMESWFALVHEREVLKCKEEMLRLSKREMELEVKYRDLNLRFKQLGEGMNDNLAANSDLLAAMLAVVEEKKEVNKLSEKAKQCYKKVNPAMQAMREKGRNFQKFKPIFSCFGITSSVGRGMIAKKTRKYRKAKKLKGKKNRSVVRSSQSSGCVLIENGAKLSSVASAEAREHCFALHTNFDAIDNSSINVGSVANEAIANSAPKALEESVETAKDGPKKSRKRKRRRQSSIGQGGKRHKGNERNRSSATMEEDPHSNSQNQTEAVAKGNELSSSSATMEEDPHPSSQNETEAFLKGVGGEITSLLAADVKRCLIERLSATPSFFKLSLLGYDWNQLCAEQAARWSKTGLRVNVARFFRNNNPFLRTFVQDDSSAQTKSFHDDVRQVVRMLLNLAEFKFDGNESCHLMLENFTPKALGWLHTYSEDQLPICPIILREKIRDLFLLHFNGTSKYIYSEPFFDSAMFINMVFHCQDKVTSLDLGELKGAEKVLRCTFPNLEELVWHSADLDDFAELSFPKLSVLSLTAEASSMAGFNVLRRCPSLKYLYTGLRVPDNPTRFDLDVLLRCYQAFWNTSASADEEDDEDVAGKPEYVISTLPKLDHVGFWNAPEKLFPIMGRCGIRFETLQFGQLNQALNRLCSLDSVMQALFKFNQPKYECYRIDVSHLRMYLHAMPVVSLDYYLPQLMMGVNDVLCSIRSLDLFVHCTFSATMPSSWVLDGRFKNSRSKLKQLTHFSLHMDGFCVFDDLDCHLPPCLTCVSISVSLPAIGASKSVASLLDFIKRLADVNAYPDLEELHIQVWGIRCAEILLNQVADHLSDLRRLSIIAMPVEEQRDRLVDLIKHVASSCPRLISLQLSAEMMRLLVDEYGDVWRTNWRLAIARLGADCDLRDCCELTIGSLPRTYGCDDYVVTPAYPEVAEANVGSEASDEAEDEEESKFSSADDSDSCSNDSFVVDDSEEGSGEDDDDIDHFDRMLEDETERRHANYLKRRARQPSSSSEEAVQEQSVDDEDDSDVEYVTDYEDEEEENGNEYRHPLIDGEAEEVESGMESSDQSDTEPEGEDIVYSSDQEMLAAEAQMVNARPHRAKTQAPKKKRIVESDTD